MKAFEEIYPEYAQQLRIKMLQREARRKRVKSLKKESKADALERSIRRRSKKLKSPKKKVVDWLNASDPSNLDASAKVNMS